MAKISALTELTAGNLASGDWLLVKDTTAGTAKKLAPADVLDALDVTAYIKTILDDTTAAAVRTTLGISSLMQTVLDDANAAAVLTTLGLDTDLATISLPANTTISSSGAAVIAAASAATARPLAGCREPWTYSTQFDLSSSPAVSQEFVSGLSSDLTEIDILFNGVGCDTSNVDPVIQVADSAGYKTSGYVNNGAYWSGGAIDLNYFTGGFHIGPGTGFGTPQDWTGIGRMRRVFDADDMWTFQSINIVATGTYLITGTGYIDIANSLEDLRVISSDGVNDVDRGEIRIRYR